MGTLFSKEIQERLVTETLISLRTQYTDTKPRIMSSLKITTTNKKKCLELPFLCDTQITPSENKMYLVFAKHLNSILRV